MLKVYLRQIFVIFTFATVIVDSKNGISAEDWKAVDGGGGSQTSGKDLDEGTLSGSFEGLARLIQPEHLLERHRSRSGSDIYETSSSSDRTVSSIIRPKRDSPAGALSESPLTERWAIIGGRVLLPCDVTPPMVGDSPILMLISRGDIPIYSVDARDSGGRLSAAVKWSAVSLRDRANFQPSEVTGLEIHPVQAADQSDYHCRVEFRDSPTRNSRVRLQIVVVPSIPIIVDGSGKQVEGVIGPYTLGDTITLTCHVKGGYPSPQVTWYHKEFLLDDLSEVTDGATTINIMKLPNLSRQHLHRQLTCKASNSDLIKAIETSVMLNMSFPPASVDIIGNEGPLSEGSRYTFFCEATGSRPPAVLTWFRGGKQLIGTTQTNKAGGDVTQTSSLVVVPHRDLHGQALSCRGTNPSLPDKYKEDVRLLDVQYPPKVSLNLGSNLKIDNIKEHDDVYFECVIISNPSVSAVQWYQNGIEVHDNKAEGVIFSNRSLVLQTISRNASGSYTCSGRNSEGMGQSKSLKLDVQYTPVCAPEQQLIYGGGRSEPVNITCLVEASPPPHTFSWLLNTSSDLMDVHSSRARNRGLSSVLAYTPQTALDYGALLCRAENTVGKQVQPCVYQVVPAAVPEPVHNCSAWHNSSASGQVVVRCWPGWHGGLKQVFSLEVHEGNDRQLVASLLNQRSPRFTVTGLRPGREYLLTVTSSNAQGVAIPVTISHLTPIDIAEKRLSKSPTNGAGSNFGPTMLRVIAGVAPVMLLCCIIMVVLLRVRTASSQRRRAPVSDKISLDEVADESQCLKPDKDPDVILVSADMRGSDKQLLQQRSECEETGLVYVNPGMLIKNAVGSDTPSFEYIESDVYAGNGKSGECSSGEDNSINATAAATAAQQLYSSGGRHLTSPTGTLKRGKGPPPGSFKPPEESSRRESKNNLKSFGNHDGSLLRVESLSDEDATRLSSGRILAPGRLSSPQRESIV